MKVNKSHYRSGEGLSVPGGWGSQISRQSAYQGGRVVSLRHRSPLHLRKYSWFSFLFHADLSITTVEEERQKRVDKHFQRLQEHENQLAINLVDVRNPKRLKRIWPCDLRGE